MKRYTVVAVAALGISICLWVLIIWGSCSVLAQTPYEYSPYVINPEIAEYYDMAPPAPIGPRFVPESDGYSLAEIIAAAIKTYKKYRDEDTKGKMK